MRWQGLLKKSGNTWVPREVGPAPFPHSGHPDILATREGPILHVATTGIQYTTDAGKSWRKLNVPGTAYYPRAIQSDDGRIFIFGHVGGDDAYGKTDQSIVMTSFRLVRKKAGQDSTVESRGLLLNYDFGRGSLPDSNGRIDDLSPSGIDAVIRPTTSAPPKKCPMAAAYPNKERYGSGDGQHHPVSP